MTACDAISPSPFSDIFEDDFINAVIDDELTRYGETSGKDSNDLCTKSLLYIYVQIRYTKKGGKCITQHIKIQCKDVGYCSFIDICSTPIFVGFFVELIHETKCSPKCNF